MLIEVALKAVAGKRGIIGPICIVNLMELSNFLMITYYISATACNSLYTVVNPRLSKSRYPTVEFVLL